MLPYAWAILRHTSTPLSRLSVLRGVQRPELAPLSSVQLLILELIVVRTRSTNVRMTQSASQCFLHSLFLLFASPVLFLDVVSQLELVLLLLLLLPDTPSHVLVRLDTRAAAALTAAWAHHV